MIIENSNGITLGELKQLIDIRIDQVGSEGEVWISNEDGLSNVCVEVCDLNREDVLLETR